MQGFLRPYNHGWFQREFVNLSLLLLKCAVVHLKELGIDPGDGLIILSAVVHYEKHSPVLRVMLFQCILDGLVLAAFALQLCPLEQAAFLVIKNAETYDIRRVEQAAKDIGRCYIDHASTSSML